MHQNVIQQYIGNNLPHIAVDAYVNKAYCGRNNEQRKTKYISLLLEKH